ncbi:type I phosphodiesterase/nucleotide pyrophosphatase [Stanieria cyanosphaera PCC 7437]|uniref:Type I phosphodiesterase/nucleotide pyrophosphatase n=1 Tax=Stanieria cyanosphaera (strain ATCC 29371 / PCC 7437) TaxID=111780 RepID=K9XYV8_STAC7|nr:alkaline phosphatase family protein [Stanieria cyanosphaera]AFZ37214.1 type I phosphodiesterase/nucleotide pyrophosphatase [Stanieria cyanosphaera PCC 7437]
MKTPIIAIGLDAADPNLIEQWMSQGNLPNLSRVRQQGIYGRLHNQVNYQGGVAEFSSTEPLWVMMTTGCLPDKTGFWDTITYNPDTYEVRCDPVYGGYDYQEYLPFYALGEKYRVAAFDVPVTRVSPGVNGIQITGWGGHHPFYPSESQPSELLPQIVAKYGSNPVYRKDNGIWWDKKYFNWVTQAVKESVATRAQICREILQQEPWDLFITAFGETHTLGHDLYNLSQPDHPLYPYTNQMETLGDPMLQGFQQVDQAVGEIIAAAPDNAYILLFAVHGMGANLTDLLSMMLLPEVLYRFNFPGKVALGAGDLNQPVPPIISKKIRNGWSAEVWGKIYEPNPIKKLWHTWTHKKFLRNSKHGLLSPYPLLDEQVELGWMPARWYSSLWPQMKAFALPAYADGHIRINLQGRDRDGIVTPAEYDSLCDQLTEVLDRLKDGRSGQPLVKQVVRTRKSPLDNDPKLPEPDLIVVWHEIPTDVVDSPDLGRIGPITYNRPGGHREHGFLLAAGPGIKPGSDLIDGRAVDLSATILNLMGAKLPDYFDGKPLLDPVLTIS